VGPLQFEVATARLEAEFKVPVTLEPLPYSVTRRTDASGAELLAHHHEVEVLSRRSDNALLAVFSNRWRLEVVARKYADILLDPLPAGSAER
jgi:peptide chain release factor 3